MLETASGGTCQDTEKHQPTEAHSPSGDGRGRDLSGDGKKPTDRGTLTSWRQNREGQVRTQKKTNRAKYTHFLEKVERGTCQDMERNRLTEAHSHPGDGIGRDLSGHRKKPTDQGALTSWRQHREEPVRTREKNQPRETHSPTGDLRGRDLSGHGKKPNNRATLTSWRGHREGLVRTRKEPTDRGPLTFWRRHREGLVRTRKNAD